MHIWFKTAGEFMGAAAILLAGMAFVGAANAQSIRTGTDTSGCEHLSGTEQRICISAKGTKDAPKAAKNQLVDNTQTAQNRPPSPATTPDGCPATGAAILMRPDVCSANPNLQICKAGAENKPSKWKKLAGDARDIGAGAGDNLWAIGADGEAQVYSSDEWRGTKIKGTRIDAGPKGTACLVGTNSAPYCYRQNRGWKRLHGRVTDIGIGGNGHLWAIGIEKRKCNFNIQSFTVGKWRKVPGAAIRIDVDPVGNPWIVNAENRIFRYEGGKWVQVAGRAKDIGISAKGDVWIIGADDAPYKLDGKLWVRTPGKLKNISVRETGQPVGTDDRGNIYTR